MLAAQPAAQNVLTADGMNGAEQLHDSIQLEGVAARVAVGWPISCAARSLA